MKIFVVTKRTLLIVLGALLAIAAALVLALCARKPAPAERNMRAAVHTELPRASMTIAEADRNTGLLSSAEEYETEVLAGFRKELPVYSVQRSDNRIALTIDAAWDDDKTPFILETLAHYNIKATFFLCGFWAETYPDQVRAIHEAGHVIGNHSMTHPHMSKQSPEQITKEITKLDDLIESITGERTTLFRAPFGEYNDSVITTVRSTGHEPIQWDIDTVDWKPERSSQTILDSVLPKIRSGSIILCHNNGYKIEEYLPTLIETAQANGYSFVTVDELLLEGETMIDANGTQKLK